MDAISPFFLHLKTELQILKTYLDLCNVSLFFFWFFFVFVYKDFPQFVTYLRVTMTTTQETLYCMQGFLFCWNFPKGKLAVLLETLKCHYW